MEALFGDTKLPVGRKRITTDDAKGSIMPRSLLPWTVMHSPSTSMVGIFITLLQSVLNCLAPNSCFSSRYLVDSNVTNESEGARWQQSARSVQVAESLQLTDREAGGWSCPSLGSTKNVSFRGQSGLPYL
jgi:hypothetical protein